MEKNKKQKKRKKKKGTETGLFGFYGFERIFWETTQSAGEKVNERREADLVVEVAMVAVEEGDQRKGEGESKETEGKISARKKRRSQEDSDLERQRGANEKRKRGAELETGDRRNKGRRIGSDLIFSGGGRRVRAGRL